LPRQPRAPPQQRPQAGRQDGQELRPEAGGVQEVGAEDDAGDRQAEDMDAEGRRAQAEEPREDRPRNMDVRLEMAEMETIGKIIYKGDFASQSESMLSRFCHVNFPCIVSRQSVHDSVPTAMLTIYEKFIFSLTRPMESVRVGASAKLITSTYLEGK